MGSARCKVHRSLEFIYSSFLICFYAKGLHPGGQLPIPQSLPTAHEDSWRRYNRKQVAIDDKRSRPADRATKSNQGVDQGVQSNQLIECHRLAALSSHYSFFESVRFHHLFHVSHIFPLVPFYCLKGWDLLATTSITSHPAVSCWMKRCVGVCNIATKKAACQHASCNSWAVLSRQMLKHV